MPKFTQEELVAFLYNEISALLQNKINTASANNPSLKAELDKLAEVKEKLGSLRFEPRQEVVDKILFYASLNCTIN